MGLVAINNDLTEELGLAGELGGDTVEEGGFFAESQDQPIGIPLTRVFSELDPNLVSEIGNEGSKVYQLYRRFRLWLIPHGVSIVRRTGNAEPVSVNVEVRYKNEDRTCSVRNLIPSPRYIHHGQVTGSLDLAGETDVSASPLQEGQADKAFLGLRFGLRSKAGISVQFCANVITPYVSAVGVNSSRCEWVFERYTDPLFGRDIQTWSVLALPKRQTEISYDIRFSFTARTFFVARRYASDWVERVCKLDG
jgi:hypothetical protein